MNDKHDEKIKSLEEEIIMLQEQLVKAQEDRVKLRKIADLEAKAAKLREALADTKGGDGVMFVPAAAIDKPFHE